jgi:hypothetical protein
VTVSALASVKGAPGLTSLACRLADHWPSDRTLAVVELDPAGGDLAARLGVNWRRGLASFATAERRDPGSSALDDHVHRFSPGLAVMVAPPVPGAVEDPGCSPIGASTVRSLLTSVSCDDFLLDIGRLSAISTAGETALELADSITIVVRPEAAQAIQLKAWAREVRRRWAGALGAVVVGTGPYRADEIASFAGVDVIARFGGEARSADRRTRRARRRTFQTEEKQLRTITTHLVVERGARGLDGARRTAPPGRGDSAQVSELVSARPIAPRTTMREGTGGVKAGIGRLPADPEGPLDLRVTVPEARA